MGAWFSSNVTLTSGKLGRNRSRGSPFPLPVAPTPSPLVPPSLIRVPPVSFRERCDDNTREIRPRFANFVFATSNARLRSLVLAPSRPPPPVPGVFLYADCRQLLAIVRRKARETELRRVRTSGRPGGYHPRRARREPQRETLLRTGEGEGEG